jgi:EAL domain-containing protein (putative c-di-GMP-specific phosphodiesterase class I)
MLVESMIKMAKAFNMKVVVEYVENEEIYNVVKEMGVDYMQGYYLGKPAKDFKFK